MLVSNQFGNIAPRLPTCARRVVTLLSRAQLLRIIISARQTGVRHRRTVTSSSRHRPRHDLHRQGRTVASSSRCPSRRPTSTHRLTSRLRHLGWTGGFAISSSTYTPETSASLADQLRHVSWTKGFASASQPLPALPCRRFITHQEMGARIKCQFW